MAFSAAAILLFGVILVAKLPALGTAVVLLLFGGLASRAAFQWVAFAALKSIPLKRRTMIAVNGAIWSMMTIGFFIFVVLYHFEHL